MLDKSWKLWLCWEDRIEGVEKLGGRPHTAEVIGSLRQFNVWSGKKAKWPPSKMLLLLPKTNSFLLACQLYLLELKKCPSINVLRRNARVLVPTLRRVQHLNHGRLCVD